MIKSIGDSYLKNSPEFVNSAIDIEVSVYYN